MTWRAAGLAILLLAAGCSRTAAPLPELSGGCAPDASPYLAANADLALGRISYCGQGDAATARILSGEFPAGTTRVPVMLAGYPDKDGIRLVAVPSDGSRPVRLAVPRIGDRWAAVELPLPPALHDRPFRLRLVDDATGLFGWAGLGFAKDGGNPLHLATLLTLLLAVALGHAWMALAAAVAPPAWSPAARASAALVALGGVGFAVFLAYVAAPLAGRSAALLLLLAPAVLAARARGRGLWRDLATLQGALAPAAALALLVLWIGLYPFDWTGADWRVPATRWRDLPIDNWLPLYLAQMLERGGIQHPLIGDWLSSDRPPLQAGLYLLFRDVLPGAAGLGYQALSSWLQALVLVPLALLLPAAGPRARAGLLLLVATSALAIVNTLFVWPKLFTAGYCLIYHLLVFGRAGPPRGRIAVLAGAVAGLALLTHGGGLFALVGSTVACLLLRRPAAWRLLPGAALGGAVAYLPWLLYQRLLDPPGDRLLKWHFAGQVGPSTDSFATALAAAWRTTGPQGWLQARLANLEMIADGGLRFFADAARLLVGPGDAAHAARMVDSGFFAMTYSAWWFSPLWLALLAPLAWRRRIAWPAGTGALALALLAGLLFWTLAMWVPKSTVVHQGSHFLALALPWLVAVVVLAVSPRLFAALLAGNVLVFLALYVFDRPAGAMAWPGLYGAGALALLGALWLACRAAAAPSGIIPASPAPPATFPPHRTQETAE